MNARLVFGDFVFFADFENDSVSLFHNQHGRWINVPIELCPIYPIFQKLVWRKIFGYPINRGFFEWLVKQSEMLPFEASPGARD